MEEATAYGPGVPRGREGHPAVICTSIVVASTVSQTPTEYQWRRACAARRKSAEQHRPMRNATKQELARWKTSSAEPLLSVLEWVAETPTPYWGYS